MISVMIEHVFGVDPDSDRHGVAHYCKGRLIALHMMRTIELIEHAKALGEPCLFGIEHTLSNKSLYARNRTGSTAAQNHMAIAVGRCQQAQLELMRHCDHAKFAYILHQPQKGNWADDKAQFEKVTGWTKQSNRDTRAAAYFGFLSL